MTPAMKEVKMTSFHWKILHSPFLTNGIYKIYDTTLETTRNGL